jgi:hypothetical protein
MIRLLHFGMLDSGIPATKSNKIIAGVSGSVGILIIFSVSAIIFTPDVGLVMPYIYDDYDIAAETQNGITIIHATDARGRSASLSRGPEYTVEYGYDTYARFAYLLALASSRETLFDYNYLPDTDIIAAHYFDDQQLLSRPVAGQPRFYSQT